jgi:hypothetical protein
MASYVVSCTSEPTVSLRSGAFNGAPPGGMGVLATSGGELAWGEPRPVYTPGISNRPSRPHC